LGIIVNGTTKAIVQGMTGTQGRFHTKLMLDYGTKIVAGVTPGKGGEMVYGVPVYDTVEEAMDRHDPDTSIIFVPAPFVYDASLEALEAGLKTLVIITEHVPVKDAIYIISRASQLGTTIIGPNTPGIITPNECKLGVMPASMYRKGSVGMVSRSGTLSYEVASTLTAKGIGQSTCIGLGGDRIIGLSFVDILKLFEKDEETKAVVLIGEIGGNYEEHAAEFISSEKYSKPVVAYVAGSIAGRSLPQEVRIGHAGAIIMGETGTAENKVKKLAAAGVKVAETLSQIPTFVHPFI
jgi:succinyl-CoA synthetase alpha subunit